MRNRFLAMAAVVATTVGLAVIPNAALAETCHGDYVHAVIGGGQKCLADGEFCSHEYASEYHRYGFDCVRYPSGYYHLRPRG